MLTILWKGVFLVRTMAIWYMPPPKTFNPPSPLALFPLGIRSCRSSIPKFHKWPQVYYSHHWILHKVGRGYPINLHHQKNRFQSSSWTTLSIILVYLKTNGMPFKNQEVATLCRKFEITQHFSTRYYPQGNGQAEATNKIILKILKKIVDTAGHD